MRLFLLIIIFTSLFLSQSFALNIEDKLEDPALEKQAQDAFRSLRCMVCSGESISDSRADLAKDLRKVVREKVKEGYTNKQVLDYVAQRYGDAILMQPPLEPATFLLWFGPIIMLFSGGLAMFFVIKRNGRKITKG